MNRRTLGRTGLHISELGFGGATAGIPNYLEAWDPSGDEEVTTLTAAIHRAVDLGVNYFDTAPGYGDGVGETLFGRALAGRRARVVIATKTGARDPEGIRASVDASLRRLATDVIDVLQFHGGWYGVEETERILNGGIETLLALRDEGKIRFLGLSAEGPTPGSSRLIATDAFDVLQVRYNIMYQHTCDHVNEAGMMREAEAREMGVVTMRSLTSGMFQRLMRQSFPDQMAEVDLDRFCLNYVLSNPFVDVALVGMRRPHEVEANVAIAADADARIDLRAVHHRFAGP